MEQHVVLTILQTTIQLLDDSNFHTVVKARQDGKASGVGMGARGTAASVTADRQVSMDGWIGGIRVSGYQVILFAQLRQLFRATPGEAYTLTLSLPEILLDYAWGNDL